VVLPDCKRRPLAGSIPVVSMHLIGAWCSLTSLRRWLPPRRTESQCTYRCVVLPDRSAAAGGGPPGCLNAPTGAWCSLTHPLGGDPCFRVQVSMHLQVRGAP